MNGSRKHKGITLISLVITIIVILILAGVSLVMLVGENGIINQAVNAEDVTIKAEALERLKLAINDYQVNKYESETKNIKDFLEDPDKYGFIVEGEESPYIVHVGKYEGIVYEDGEFNEETFQLSGSRPKISNIKISKDDTENVEDYSIQKGESVEIEFDVEIDGGEIKTITPSLPYTTDGIEEEVIFSITTMVNGIETISKQVVSIKDKYVKTPVTLEEALNMNIVIAFSKNDNVVVTDEYGNNIEIPSGFGIAKDSGRNATEGIVIEDENNGNQFVWVPVGIIKTGSTEDVEIKLSRYQFDAEGNWEYKAVGEDVENANTWNGREYFEKTDIDYKNAIAINIDEFIEKTENAGGYYIARYEASDIDNNEIPESKYDQTVWNNVTQAKASEASINMYNNANYTSDLINSLAWDTALTFIQTFGQSNYSQQNRLEGTALATGKAEDEQLKINDMASNFREWSTEISTAAGTPCVSRGGNYNGMTYTACYRHGIAIDKIETYVSFRAIMYLN